MSRSTHDYHYGFPSNLEASQAASLLKLAGGLLSAEEQGSVAKEALEELAPEAYDALSGVLLDLEDLVVLEAIRVDGAALLWTLVVHDDLQEYAPPEARDHDYEGALLNLVRLLGGQSAVDLAQAKREQEQQAALEGTGDVSPEDLLSALEALGSALRVLDRVFLDDFRMQVRAGTVNVAQRARAAEILRKHAKD